MTDPADARLLSFLEGSMDAEDRQRLLADVDADPELSAALREAARGLDAVRLLGPVVEGDAEPARTDSGAGSPAGPRITPWWAVAASVATLLVSWPLATATARRAMTVTDGGPVIDVEQPIPADTEPSFVLVLHGTWSDAGAVPQDEAGRRAREYWSWTGELARSGVLVAAGDLTWEAGERLGPTGVLAQVDDASVASDDFVVGMFAVRATTYEEALAVARACPHLRYGGSVSVRRVGAGFVTVPGMDDWSE